MTKPNVLVISGYGINCEEETLFAFEKAGGQGDIVHINDIIEEPSILEKYQILAFAGGFSYGDDTGSGNAFAARIKNNLWEEIQAFIARDTLVIGICNGCQILTKLGLVGNGEATLTYNANNTYQCRWVDLQVADAKSVWLDGIKRLHIPVAHGEGNFIFKDGKERGVALQYTKPDGSLAGGEFPYNPNGSAFDTAAIVSDDGKILAIMPHPERAILFTQRDDFPSLKEQYIRAGQALPDDADGLAIFKNGVKYFK